MEHRERIHRVLEGITRPYAIRQADANVIGRFESVIGFVRMGEFGRIILDPDSLTDGRVVWENQSSSLGDRHQRIIRIDLSTVLPGLLLLRFVDLFHIRPVKVEWHQFGRNVLKGEGRRIGRSASTGGPG